MYAGTLQASRTGSSIASAGVAAAACALIGLASFPNGSGSVLDLSQIKRWGGWVRANAPLEIEIGTMNNDGAEPFDVRTASEHLANIREVLNPAIADLAVAVGVSRQAVYKWMNGESEPEPDHLARIQTLSRVASAFAGADIKRAPALLKMKTFDGRSLLDLVAADEADAAQVQRLIAEARTMERAYDQSGLARTQAAPSDDWRASVSIPGRAER